MTFPVARVAAALLSAANLLARAPNNIQPTRLEHPAPA